MPQKRTNGNNMTQKRFRRRAATAATATVATADIYLQFVPRFLQMVNTVKLYHWRTLSYSTHKATDDLFVKLNEKVDEFMEILLGKQSSETARAAILTVGDRMGPLQTHTNNDDFKAVIKSYIAFLLHLSEEPSFNTLANTDLLNLRDEMVGIFNQFLYLLTLS
jgi:hypothetical protein